DLTILARNWKQPGDWSTGDFNGDGFVDLADLTILARNWKNVIHDDYLIYLDDLSWADALASVTFGAASLSFASPFALSSIPEPASLAILGLGAAGLVRHRRHQ
ncbi:MAG: PEP-CTERM sorting domain-containing protein, partial [Phycisphaerales bacterium]|nr:PEP-CTERM sorting domain-containing protein [Phycisphaerales bacterium]